MQKVNWAFSIKAWGCMKEVGGQVGKEREEDLEKDLIPGRHPLSLNAFIESLVKH